MSARYLLPILTLALLPPAAWAQSDDARPARPFAAWMKLDSSLTERLPSAQVGNVGSPQIWANAHTGKNTKIPMITPDDTTALINHLYGGETAAPAQSTLEQAYSKRIVEQLFQYGYDLFSSRENRDTGKDNEFSLPAGAVQDDFTLNIGDRVTIAFRGQRQDNKTYAVTSQGTLIVDDMPPISVAGRTVAQVRESLQAEADKLYNTEVYLSLESVRQASVLLVGHVARPGRHTLTAFHTVLDALSAAGGVKKTGSLRQVKLVRDGRSTLIDLYSLLLHGSPALDLALRDGDRIIVPAIGPTIGISGNVKQPGIYEILPDLKGNHHDPEEKSQLLSLEDVLSLAGGTLSAGQNRFMKLALTADGQEKLEEITDTLRPVFGDSSILVVAPSTEARTGTVELTGHTRRPGLHDLGRSAALSDLLDDEKTFGPDIYPLLGLIERRNRNQMTPELIAFPPVLILQGEFDRRLQDGDVVHLFSRADILDAQGKKKDSEDATAKRKGMEQEYGSTPEMDNWEDRNDPVILSFLRERSVFMRGAVRQGGAWPVAEGVTLENLLAVAGGLTLEASTSNIEVTSRLQGEGHQADGNSGIQRVSVNLQETDPATVMIAAGDTIRVNQKFKRVAENSVLLIGEVARPGRYDLMPGDKMSDLLARAGGMTEQAYPDGAIFSREQERRSEEARFRAQARDLEMKLAAALEKEKDEPGPDKVAAVQELVTQLKQAEALGRITVEADPAVLATKPELDILLQSGDRIYVPQRPLTVRVAGEVLSGASLQFRKDKDASDYIMQAGGFTYDADKDRVFVLYPDGSAQPLAVNVWNHSPAFIPPGSTIVVPRDPKPFDFIQTAKDVSQIISNLAITGIFIDDIRDDD